MSIENRCPYCWDTGDLLDQGGSVAKGYNVRLVRCGNHTHRTDVPSYLHLWDEAHSLDLGQFRQDWEFTKLIHRILFDALNLSSAEFQRTCVARYPSDLELKHNADLLAKVIFKNIYNENIEQLLRRELLNILKVEEESREDDFLKLVIEYYLLFNLKSGLARMGGRTMKPFRSFEYHLFDREYKQQNWDAIIYTGEYE